MTGDDITLKRLEYSLGLYELWIDGQNSGHVIKGQSDIWNQVDLVLQERAE